MIEPKEGAASVESFDALHAAYEAAMARIEAVSSTMGQTLVDSISAAEWQSWNASDEKALITDPSGVDGFDALDTCDEQQAA